MTSATHWRILNLSNNGDSYCGLAALAFYVGIGSTTACTAGTPIGINTAASANGSIGSAFDGVSSKAARWEYGVQSGAWIGYIFPSPVEINFVGMRGGFVTAQMPRIFNLQYSTDQGSNWTTVYTVFNSMASKWMNQEYECIFGNPSSSMAWRVFNDANNGDGYCGITELIFRTYAGTGDNTTILAWGAPIAGPGYDNPPARAFNNSLNTSDRWQYSPQSGAWVGMLYPWGPKIVEVSMRADQFPAQTPKFWGLEYSTDNGSSWTRVLSVGSGSASWSAGSVRLFPNSGGGGWSFDPPTYGGSTGGGSSGGSATYWRAFPNRGNDLFPTDSYRLWPHT